MTPILLMLAPALIAKDPRPLEEQTMSRFLILALSLAVPAGAGEAKAPPRTGDFKDDFKDPSTGTVLMKYRLRAPQKLPDRNHLGLIICFHGLNGNEDGITGFAIEAVSRNGLADQYVIAGGKSKGDGWAEVDDKDLLAWIEWVKRSYPIDPRRVHLIGMSNGGWMVNPLLFPWPHIGCLGRSDAEGTPDPPGGHQPCALEKIAL